MYWETIENWRAENGTEIVLIHENVRPHTATTTKEKIHKFCW